MSSASSTDARCVVFAGPSVRGEDRRILPQARWCPPAKRGDLYLAARHGASVIGLIDGYFRTTPSVMHKEILWALAQGVCIYGSASMGALRASELDAFGMIGIGRIYRDFRDGRFWRDDEVAVAHGPDELGFPAVSEALVNIRYTLDQAAATGRIGRSMADELVRTAGRMHYAERSYAAIARMHNAMNPRDALSESDFSWIMEHRIDQKKVDATELLMTVRDALAQGRLPTPQPFTFEDTVFFARLRGFLDNPILRGRA